MTHGLPIARGETRLRFSGFTANIGDLKALPELAERLGMALRKHTKSPTKSPTKATGFWTGLFFILGRGIIPWLYHVFFFCWKLLREKKLPIQGQPQDVAILGCPHLPLGRWDGARLVKIQKKMEEQLKYT